jgi:hypothetical protein
MFYLALHCDMVRRVYRYLMTNHQFGLKYVKCNPICLIGYSDASYANSYDSSSMSGYDLLVSNTLVSWYSHTQSVVALSTAEAEYIDCCNRHCQRDHVVRNFPQRAGVPTRQYHNLRRQPCCHPYYDYFFELKEVMRERASTKPLMTRDQLFDLDEETAQTPQQNSDIEGLKCLGKEILTKVKSY